MIAVLDFDHEFGVVNDLRYRIWPLSETAVNKRISQEPQMVSHDFLQLSHHEISIHHNVETWRKQTFEIEEQLIDFFLRWCKRSFLPCLFLYDLFSSLLLSFFLRL